MVVLGKIKPLFELDIEPYGVAAVKDVVPCIDEHRVQLSIPYGQDYFCSALMLINLKYWREHDSEARLLEFAKRERKIFCHDQDALNYVFKNSWYQLPPKWNRFSGWLFPDRYFKTKQINKNITDRRQLSISAPTIRRIVNYSSRSKRTTRNI